jgi:shikimate kinase
MGNTFTNPSTNGPSRKLPPNLNICLVGAPGSGKTTVGRALAKLLQMRHLDVDDDVLEPAWGCSVAAKLAELGDAAFVAAESAATCQMGASKPIVNTVISLTGSNGVDAATMKHVRETLGAVVVLLDAKVDDIVARCERMKVDRIVGQASQSLQSIIERRLVAYNQAAHARVYIAGAEAATVVAVRVATVVARLHTGYISTRGCTDHSFQEVVCSGRFRFSTHKRASPPRFPSHMLCCAHLDSHARIILVATLQPHMNDSFHAFPFFIDRNLWAGLAPDGGLFWPADGLPPPLQAFEWQRL